VVHRIHTDPLAAVWVGFDNNQPIGLSGRRPRPDLTNFMKRALAGRKDRTSVRRTTSHVDIDKDARQARAAGLSGGHSEAF
jgi:membrane carboxypeptidase/penicillin-binding protein